MLVPTLGNHWHKALTAAGSANSFCVVPFVRDKKRKTVLPGQSLHTVQKGDEAGLEGGEVIDIACRQCKPQRIAALVAYQVELAGEAAARSSKRLSFLSVFLGAPAA